MTPVRIILAMLFIAAGVTLGLMVQSVVDVERGCVQGCNFSTSPLFPLICFVALVTFGAFVGACSTNYPRWRKMDYPIFLSFCFTSSFWVACIYEVSVFYDKCEIIRCASLETAPYPFWLLVIFVLFSFGYLIGLYVSG